MIYYVNEETEAQKSTMISAHILTLEDQLKILRLKKVPRLVPSPGTVLNTEEFFPLT